MKFDELEKIEERDFATMKDNQVMAYWNVLQMGKRCLQIGGFDALLKVERHEKLIDKELTKRGIPHKKDKLINPV